MDILKKQYSNEFYIKLLQNLPKDENIIISPLSIYTALSMVALGSEENTQREFQDVLGFNNKEQLLERQKQFSQEKQKLSQVQVANKIYYSLDHIEQQYENIIKEYYEGNLQKADFFENMEQEIEKINEWVSKNTQNMIKKLLDKDSISKNTHMLIVNAIYFKGNWLFKFNKNQTKKDQFYFSGTNIQQVSPNKIVDMMNQEIEVNYYENDSLQYVSIPYEGNQICMDIILPKQDIQFFENQMNINLINDIRSKSKTNKVQLSLPRFKLEDQLCRDLAKPLYNMGLRDCFSEQYANFTAIEKQKGLFVNKILHKAIIELNEEGSRAAASTAVEMLKQCKQPETEQKQFKCNKPFLFIIRTVNSNEVLFVGRVLDPQELLEVQNENNNIFQKIKNCINKLF